MKKLLIVIDMQNDFIDGSLGTGEAKAIVPAVKERISQYQREGHDVVFTMDTHYDNYLETLEGKHLPVEHCRKQTRGWELCPELAQFEGRRFEKSTFGSVEAVRHAAEGDYDAVELAGLCTDICVITNALLLRTALPGTPIYVDPSCCAGVTKESHLNALEAMRLCHVDLL